MIKTNKHTILSTENLTIGYSTIKGNLIVSKNINVLLQKGELVGLVGANGIGKSTLLRTITKVQKPLSGSIFIESKNLNQFNHADLAKSLSLVLTEPLASKNLSVLELVALGRQPYTNWIGSLSPLDKNIINRALKQINIKDLKDKKCFELSDGQLQKALLARALAQDTNLIILDEPTTHLDVYHKAFILKLLQKLVRETQKTILFSSHEIDLAIQLCDKLIVMSKDGVIMDTPCNLIENGAFDALFPKDMIAFDEKTGSFRVQK